MTPKKEDLLGAIVSSSSSPWMDGSGALSDVVISSRIRLARNLHDVQFPHLLEEDQAKEVQQKVFAAIEAVNAKAKASFGRLQCLDLSQVSPLERQVLVEKHLMSPQHAQVGFGKGLVVRADERVSIMVNEEDHLRIQCLYSGLELDEALTLDGGIDDLLDERLDFAFDERVGFLTRARRTRAQVCVRR
jgi:protein arginine kinase